MWSWIAGVGFWMLMTALLIFILSAWQTKKRYRFYSQHEMELRKADPAVQSFCVRYCSEQRFERRWGNDTWEAWSLLTIQDKQIVFAGENSSGRDLRFVFEKDPSTIEFGGRRYWCRTESWIRILDASKRQHYFTPETGTFFFGSMSACKNLYQRLVAAVA